MRDYPGESAFDDFRVGVLGELPLADLQELQRSENFYQTESTLAIYSGHFRKVKAQIEKNLVDGFEGFFDERREPLLGTPAEPSASVFSFVRGGLLQPALELFCSKASKPDLATVRQAIDKYKIKFSAEIAEFLSKYGEWEDAVRLARLSGNLPSGLGLSFISSADHSGDYQLAAKSILKLGARRIADVRKLDFSTLVRLQFVKEMSNRLFSAFDNQSIINMLLMESDAVRETVALKAILCLPKSRLSSILDAYYEVDGSYYYNVIFWLDLGVSADRATSRAVALSEIRNK